MAGVSEGPFRQLCRSFGADVVVSEFLPAAGLARGIPRVLEECAFEPVERPIGIQIYGADRELMGRAAGVVVEAVQPDFIDINFGCPVKKVVRNNGGSGCLRDLDLVTGIIRAVREATDLPVTVKIRSGWNEATRDPVAIGQRCQDAGAQALTLHPRTRTQMYRGDARWDEIARVVDALDIPVIGNGDVRTADDVVRMRRATGCAGVMIARGSFGNPWIFAEARALLEGQERPAPPSAEERFETALRHARLARRLQGETRRTVIEFRKHLGWYTRGLPGATDLRSRLHQVESMDQVAAIFEAYLARRSLEPAA
jgi:nifR3 family TIM-barrel protein